MDMTINVAKNYELALSSNVYDREQRHDGWEEHQLPRNRRHIKMKFS